MTDTWEEHARKDLQPKMASSAYVISITPDEDIDPKIALETGYAVLMNKPIILVTMPGRIPPPGLVRIAHRHIQLHHSLGSDEGVQELMAELASMPNPE